jgi:hypothetical protein
MFTLRASMLLSFVPIITQGPASGGSALIGYAGRFTASSVSKETKESSAIITAPTQIAALGSASISYVVLRRLRREVPEKLNGRLNHCLAMGRDFNPCHYRGAEDPRQNLKCFRACAGSAPKPTCRPSRFTAAVRPYTPKIGATSFSQDLVLELHSSISV